MGSQRFWWVVGPLWACSVAGLACSIAALWFVLDLRDRTQPNVAQVRTEEATGGRARALEIADATSSTHKTSEPLKADTPPEITPQLQPVLH